MIITHRNKDFKRAWQYLNVDKSAIVLTDAYAEFVLMDREDPTIAAYSFVSPTNITIDGATGNIVLFVAAASFDIPAGEYQYFLRVILADGSCVMLEKSYMQVLFLPDLPEVTTDDPYTEPDDPYTEPEDPYYYA